MATAPAEKKAPAKKAATPKAAAPKKAVAPKAASTGTATGRIAQVIAAVVAVQFTGKIPGIMTALETDNNGNSPVRQGRQHPREHTVRTHELSATQGQTPTQHGRHTREQAT